MLRGLTTITYSADDVDSAAQWYQKVLGVEPYFRKEFGGALAYVEFRIGDYSHELGILDRRYVGDTPAVQGGTVAYWAVDDVQTAYERLLALGASSHTPVTEQGPGFVTASVFDPFGNVLGVMENAHYEEVLAGRDVA
ncbi:VOC family protein [Planococcus sp. APC 4015]|nr:VOC family protein [Planococcus sp. APC 4015]